MKQKLQPNLRFPEFEGEWKKEKLINKVNSISSGKIKPKEVGEFFVYGSTGIIGKSDIFSHEGDYILVARVGANAGQINRAKGKFSVTDNTLIIDLKDKDSVSFLESFLKKYNLNKLIFGSGQPLITGGLLKNIDFISPSLPEQTKIASFLTAVDDKLQALKHKLTLLEQYKKGVMQKIFAQELRFKPSPSEALNIGDEYSDWEEKKLGEVCNYKNGGSFEKFVTSEGLYNLISLNSIDINGKLKEQHKKVSITDNSLQKGDLIMVLSDVAHGNFLGLTDIIPNDEFVLNQRMAALKPKTDYNSFYLKTYINYNQDYFKLMGQGSSQLNLSKGDVENFIVKLPSLLEQQKIASFLSAIDEKIEKTTQQLTQTETFKKGLLQQLFV